MLINYMKIILLLLYIRWVNGCLMVFSVRNPNMRNCKCPPFKLSNQEDIRKNEGGKYLGDHKVWDAIVETDDDCKPAITCRPVPGVSSFLTVLFRSNGPPIYINRVVGNQETFGKQPRSIENFECKEVDGEHQWVFLRGERVFSRAVVQDVSFACIADKHSCDCPQITIDTESGATTVNRVPSANNQCGYINATCSNYKFHYPYLYSPKKNFINPGAYLQKISFYQDLLCVTEKEKFNWYFANLKFEDSISVTCNASQGSDVERSLKDIESFDGLEWYHKKGDYADALFQKFYSGAISEMYAIYDCKDGYNQVIFSQNMEPIEPITDGDGLTELRYAPSSSHSLIWYWIIDGIQLINPTYSCVKRLPKMRGCKCNVTQLNQVDIRKNAGGRYLGDHKVWNAIVEAQDDCSLSITCKPRDGVSSFLTVLFRSNGPPLYVNRVVGNKVTYLEQPRSIETMRCAEVDGEHQWFVSESVAQDVSFACIADTHSCDCPQITIDTESGASYVDRMPSATNQCGFFEATCSQNGYTPYLYSAKNYFVNPGMFRQETPAFYQDLLCVKEKETFNWYFGNLKFEDPISVICDANQEGNDYCSGLKEIVTSNDLEWYHKKGDYADALFQKYELTTPAAGVNYKCRNGYNPVIFSQNMEPIESNFKNGYAYVRCLPSPSHVFVRYYAMNGIHFINPAYACVKKRTAVEMNGCQCPQLKYINQTGIEDLGEHSAYLSNRTAYLPIVTVDSNCKVMVDERGVGLDNPDHYLMIFREKMPPVFMRRFLNGVQTSPYPLTDLLCKQRDGKYQWFYEDARLSENSLYFALQSNKESCDCPKFSFFEEIVMEEQLETCDILKFTPNSPENFTEIRIVVETIPGVSNLADYLAIGPDTFTMAGAVCANDQWYLNGFAFFVEPKFSSISKGFDEMWNFTRHCHCEQVEQVFAYQFNNPSNQHFIQAIDREGVFINRTIQGGSRIFVVESCEMIYNCKGSGELVVFNYENGPISFPGQTITGKCRSPPVANSDVLKPFAVEKYWWFDNYMLHRPQITCFEK